MSLNQLPKGANQLVIDWWNTSGPIGLLHKMNTVRVPFVKDGMVNAGILTADDSCQTEIVNVLDVGCGGGILSEPLSKLSRKIKLTGLDANAHFIKLAQEHAHQEGLDIAYVTSTIEDHASRHAGQYDVIVASEVIEHVTKKEEFLDACLKCLKPNGSIFMTTISQSKLANFVAIFMYENLGLIPKGTHEIEKLITPADLGNMLKNLNCDTKNTQGYFYNLLTGRWNTTTNTDIFYCLHAIKKQN
ncbi:unnamed protein product [Brassicogethes aeneus]|uniref:Ubiquinone biosynthesis O-methyltransferase, mitochondrial n=1 Tax=Brassicogethes aeneus TaxID=1431903 RepID=A0A9P0B9E1_BRAAE|nr:unnamed protein product [Brassicogethes aeneus]